MAKRFVLLVLATAGLLLSSSPHKAKNHGPWRLLAPTEMAKTERVVSEDDQYEGQECVRGLAYSGRGVQVFSTHAAALKTTRRQEALDHFIVTGEEAEAVNLTDLLCSDAAVSHIVSLGAAESKLFDGQQLFLGEASQDDCDDTEVMSIARRGSHYFVFRQSLKLLSSCTCDADTEPPKQTDTDCARRFDCLKAFFAQPDHLAELKAKWRALQAPLRFGD